MNRSRLLPALALAVIAGGIYVFLRGTGAPAPVVPSVPPAAVAVESPPAAIPQATRARSAPPVVPVDPGLAPGSGLLEQEAAIVRLAHAQSERMEQRWAADAHDPAAAQAIVGGLLQTLGAERMTQVRDQPARVAGVDCRATLCRIEAVFPEGKSGNEWATRLLMELGGTFGGSELVVLPGAVGEQNLVVYAYRAGHTPR